MIAMNVRTALLDHSVVVVTVNDDTSALPLSDCVNRLALAVAADTPSCDQNEINKLVQPFSVIASSNQLRLLPHRVFNARNSANHKIRPETLLQPSDQDFCATRRTDQADSVLLQST